MNKWMLHVTMVLVMVGLGAAGYTLTSKSTAAAGVALFSALGAILLMHFYKKKNGE